MSEERAGDAWRHVFPWFWPNCSRTSKNIRLSVPSSGGEGTRRPTRFPQTKPRVLRLKNHGTKFLSAALPKLRSEKRSGLPSSGGVGPCCLHEEPPDHPRAHDATQDNLGDSANDGQQHPYARFHFLLQPLPLRPCLTGKSGPPSRRLPSTAPKTARGPECRTAECTKGRCRAGRGSSRNALQTPSRRSSHCRLLAVCRQVHSWLSPRARKPPCLHPLIRPGRAPSDRSGHFSLQAFRARRILRA